MYHTGEQLNLLYHYVSHWGTIKLTISLHWSTNYNFFFLATTSTTDSYRVWAADSESVLRFAPSHQVFQLFDILYWSMFIC